MLEFSFIVPVYKVEKYIAECITSILKIQKFNFEILIVDDGSPDRSIEIVKSAFGEDERLRIIRLPENRGVSVARNTGIREARGKYLSWIDPDDYIEPSALEYIYEYFIKNQTADIWCNSAFEYFQDGEQPQPIAVPEYPPANIKHYSGRSFFIHRKFLSHGRTAGMPYYIFKRKFILEHSLFFGEGLIYEDVDYIPRLLYPAATVIDTNISFYYCRIRANSATTHIFSKRLPCIKQIIKIQAALAAKIKPKDEAFARAIDSWTSDLIIIQLLKLTIPIAERKAFRIWSKPYLKSHHPELNIRIYIFLIKYAYPLATLVKKIALKVRGRKQGSEE